MRRRAFNSKPAPSSGHKSKSSAVAASLSSWLSFLHNNNVNVLVLLLSIGILFWIFLCFHIHLQLSYTPIGSQLRSRFMTRRDPPPSSQTINGNNNHSTRTQKDGLSACLLVNDENPRLPEWIAYHYQILPLRSLIVAVDPASRSSPAELLDRWSKLMGLEVQIWEEKRYMPYGGDGACNASDPHMDCLKHHRKRQQHFVRACMADFQQRNKTWVLLTDVDEYITFNTKHDTNDPPVPLDAAPEGIPTLSNWTWSVRGFGDPKTGKRIDETLVKGILSGLPEEGWHGKKNGQPKTTLPLINRKDEIFYGAYGSVFTDTSGGRWFLRDDFAFRDAIDMPPEQVPQNVPTIKDSNVRGNTLHGTIDGESVEIQTNWREPTDPQVLSLLLPTAPLEIKTIHGGHMMRGLNGKQYYVERDTMLWPPHLSSQQLMAIRKRLPTVGDDDGKTILDVLNSEMQALGAEYANETIGPCLCMPRVLYGSQEDQDHPSWKSMAPEGFDDDDFVTLRYQWHSLPDNRVNKYQKTIIDMSRIPRKLLKGEAENIHTPVKYYCREKQPPRYSASFFRVNHYLDSFEAYSYRNDARAGKRQCKSCYDEKGREAAKQMDDDIRPWLKGFVDSVGHEKAKLLLAGAGNFVHLS